MTSFKGWGQSWLDSWGPVTVDPNAMQGSASFSFTASLQVNSGEMQGSASFRIDAILGVGEPRYSAEVELKPRKWYVKRNKQILIFATAQEADDFLDAETKAQEAIEKAQKTSRRARKRLRDKLLPKPQSIDIEQLESLAERYSFNVDLPALVLNQDYERLMYLYQQALELQDEEDVEMLLSLY